MGGHIGNLNQLELQPGVVAVVGSGGKSTFLALLGRVLAEQHSVLLCTTTKIYPFPNLPCARNQRELDALRETCPLLCAGTPIPGSGGKLGPFAELSIEELAKRFDYVLVEADGSHGLPLKAHTAKEPVIPASAAQTITVVGASGFGRPIREVVHRPEQYAKLAGVEVDAVVTPEMEASVLKAEKLCQLVLVNQVDSPEQLEAAKALAKALKRPVLAGSLWKGGLIRC